MAAWDASDWAAVVTVAVLLLGLLAGGVWWMSALYSKTRAICTTLGEMKSQLQTALVGQQAENAKLWDHLHKLEREFLLHIAQHGKEGGS